LPCNSRKPGDDPRFAAGCRLIALRLRRLLTAPVPRCRQYPRERRQWLAQPLGSGDWLAPNLPSRSRSKLPQAPPRETPRRFASCYIILSKCQSGTQGRRTKHHRARWMMDNPRPAPNFLCDECRLRPDTSVGRPRAPWGRLDADGGSHHTTIAPCPRRDAGAVIGWHRVGRDGAITCRIAARLRPVPTSRRRGRGRVFRPCPRRDAGDVPSGHGAGTAAPAGSRPDRGRQVGGDGVAASRPVPTSRRRGVPWGAWASMGQHLPDRGHVAMVGAPARACVATPGPVGCAGHPLPDRGQAATSPRR
jgi:hypothetical protein